jgi:four helix bundle protein
MDKMLMKKRTKDFALRTIKVVTALPKSAEARVIANQIAKSGTSVGANYRASCRARSNKEFIAKLGTALEETDETAFWLEIIKEANILPSSRIEPLLKEADELCAIFFTTIDSARKK